MFIRIDDFYKNKMSLNCWIIHTINFQSNRKFLQSHSIEKLGMNDVLINY